MDSYIVYTFALPVTTSKIGATNDTDYKGKEDDNFPNDVILSNSAGDGIKAFGHRVVIVVGHRHP